MIALKQLPASVVLERMPVPVLAVVQDGTNLFANTAFAEMTGWATDEIMLSTFDQTFHKAPAGEPVISIVHTFPNMLV